MDTPGSSQPKTKRDPERNKINQKLYQQRKYAAVNGIEDVKALSRRRYQERMARMKANGEYKAFKAKKVQEGMRRCHAMSEEKRNEVKRRNAQCQKNWMQRMKEEGTAAGVAGGEKASLGRGGVESLAETKVREAGGIDSTSTQAMVGRAIGPSFSPPVVTVRLGRVRA